MWMMVTLTEIETRGMVASAAVELDYTANDEITKFKVEPVDFKDLEEVDVSGKYLTWSVSHEYYHTIYTLDLENGKTEKLTADKTYKYKPVIAETHQGPMVLWVQSNESQGRDLWSYNIDSNEKKKLIDGGSSMLINPVGDGNYIALVDGNNIKVFNLTTKEIETIGEGSNPQLGKNLLTYQDGTSGVYVYDLNSKIKDDFFGSSFSSNYSFNGKHVLLQTRIRENQDYMELDATAPSEKGAVLVKAAPFHLSKIFTGLSYGLWVEKGEGNKSVVTGVDLLHKEPFSMSLNATYNHVLGLSGDTLIYINKDGFIVKRSLVAPSIRSVRDEEPIHVVMEGEELVMRAAPFTLNNSTYVEFRSLFEKMGFTIKWDNKARRITGTKGSLEIKLTINQKEITVNGKTIKAENAPVIRNGTTYVPLRLIGEAADRKVGWNEQKKTVYISPKDTKDTLYNEDGTMLYQGELVNGIREGYGTLYHDNEQVEYVGQWKNDKMHGKGKMYYLFTNDLFFEGTMEEGKQVEGIEYYPGGAVRYKGSYYRTALHWEGVEVVLNQKTGEYLVVEISQGRREGAAIWYYANDKVKIEGDFAGNRFIKGILYDVNGNVMHQGEFDSFGNPLK